MSGTNYRHDDVADGIAAVLAAGDNAFAEVGERASRVSATAFVVTLDSGQRFVVTVESADAVANRS